MIVIVRRKTWNSNLVPLDTNVLLGNRVIQWPLKVSIVRVLAILGERVKAWRVVVRIGHPSVYSRG